MKIENIIFITHVVLLDTKIVAIKQKYLISVSVSITRQDVL